MVLLIIQKLFTPFLIYTLEDLKCDIDFHGDGEKKVVAVRMGETERYFDEK